MGSHLWLTVLALVICITTSSGQLDISLKNQKIINTTEADLKIGKDIPLPPNPRTSKEITDSEKVLLDLTNGNFTRDTNIPLAQDPRFNKMLPDIITNHLEEEKPLKENLTTPRQTPTPTTTVGTTDKDVMKDDFGDDYYYDYNQYDDDDDEDDESADEEGTTIKPTTPATIGKNEEKMKPIENNDKSKNKNNKINKVKGDTVVYEDDVNVEDEILFNKNVPCPENCTCGKNMNGYIVATCTSLDIKLKFGADITDLEVLNVKPNQPIVLGAEFFKSIGLTRVSSIKISNSHIDYIHPSAFEGLYELYSVNLTNTGIDLIHPDTFSGNHKLRLLTLAGNDLHAMQQKSSPFMEYMLNAPSLEELDISQCKLNRLLPTAFSKLSNIVYINLADNQLRTLPEKIFDKVETLEELDLSSNSIEDLPKNIFAKTSLSILNLKYNEITTKLDFVPADTVKLDLSYNKITYVNNMMFQHIKGLTSLILKGNAIRKIHESAFYPLKQLRHIDLSFNDLEQISSLIFLGNVELDVIRLNDNPRLKKLPLDGFESTLGGFNVYFFDASNCDISDLGDNTFSTMPHLSTLNLSWNNIETIGKGLLSYLSKLIELDMSNNLVTDLSDLTFFHNQQLKKLNLAGNPLQQLSMKLFLPTKQLTELDISDCDLNSIWTDGSITGVRYVAMKNLKILNVSSNNIEHVHLADLDSMISLSMLDMSYNKLHCDDDFMNLIKWLNKGKVRIGNLHNELEYAELTEAMLLKRSIQERTWDDFSRDICHKDATNFKPNKEIIDTEFDSDDEDDEDDDDDDEADINGDIVDDVRVADNCEDCDDSDEYDDDDEPRATSQPKTLKDDDSLNENMKIIRTLENDETIILERRPFIYYGQYRYLMPILIIVFGVLAILLLIGKIVSLLMRRRGERYRQALLASKNSIVYQKLTEDIYGPTTPKFNRFAPINQV